MGLGGGLETWDGDVVGAEGSLRGTGDPMIRCLPKTDGLAAFAAIRDDNGGDYEQSAGEGGGVHADASFHSRPAVAADEGFLHKAGTLE